MSAVLLIINAGDPDCKRFCPLHTRRPGWETGIFYRNEKKACFSRLDLLRYIRWFFFKDVGPRPVHSLEKAYRFEKEVQMIMAKCDICGKSVTFGIQVSHSHRRSNRTWKPNIKRVKAVVDGSPKRIYACTRCLRSNKVTRAV